MQYRKAGRVCMIWDTTSDIGTKRSKSCLFTSQPYDCFTFPMSIYLSVPTFHMRNNHVTYIVAVWLDFSLFSWLWWQRECQMQAATHVMPTESLMDWEGLPGDLFSGLQCSKSKLVLDMKDQTCFFWIFATVHVRFIPGSLLFFP